MDVKLLLLTLCAIFHTAGATKPNIIVILTDDVGWNDVGYAGDRQKSGMNIRPKTPFLDGLAARGLKMEHNYVMPTCTPSRIALMTGRYPYTIGIHGIFEETQPVGLPTSLKILPQYLKELGYKTHAIGKWHLGQCHWDYTPLRRGFDSFLGFHGGAEHYFTHEKSVKATGLSGYDYWKNEQVYPADRHLKTLRYSTYDFGNRTVEIIKDAKDDDQPFFIYLAMQAAHAPLAAPKEYMDIYGCKGQKRCKFMAIMTAMDDQIKLIHEALEETGQLSNTIIIFSSDNGGKPSRGGDNSPLRGTKTTLWEGGTRVPAFVYGKNIEKGRYNGMHHIVDWLPTIVAMAGGQVPDQLDGVNHWNAIKGNHQSRRNEMIYNVDPMEKRAGIRVGNHKLLVGEPGHHNQWYNSKRVDGVDHAHDFHSYKLPCTMVDGKCELPDDHALGKDIGRLNDLLDGNSLWLWYFNLANDPNERDNLAGADTESDINKLLSILKVYLQKAKSPMLIENDFPSANPHRSHDNSAFNGVWAPDWCNPIRSWPRE